jgi:DNA-binding winged helix-turn-helix (wHTH) protein
MTEARTKRLRFGVFDFEPASGELRREGIPIRLQAQPAQVLGVLLENAGAVVSREALRQAVWGGGTHVDFDSGLNFCIAQVRSALGESAESPVYIKTVPKRGYQFIAPVSVAEEAVLPPAAVPARSRRAMLLAAGASVAGSRACTRGCEPAWDPPKRCGSPWRGSRIRAAIRAWTRLPRVWATQWWRSSPIR